MLKHENEVDSKLMQRARTINHKPQSILIFKEEKVSKSILAYFTFTFSNTKGTSYGHVSKSHDMVDMHVCPTPPHNLLSLRTCRTPQTNKKKNSKSFKFCSQKKRSNTPICNESPKSNSAIDPFQFIYPNRITHPSISASRVCFKPS